jgi:hypothetical protein
MIMMLIVAIESDESKAFMLNLYLSSPLINLEKARVIR